MTIYLDVIFFINFFFDYILLFGVKVILKRNVKQYRLILGSIIGSITTFLLFFKMNSLELFSFKILLSLVMIMISFSYKNIRYFFKNFVTLYLVSCVLGGFLYFLNISFSYKQKGLIFFHNGLSINIIFMIVISPLIIYLYIKEQKRVKQEYNNYHQIDLIINGITFNLNAYLDTGNNLVDPVSKKKVILVKKKLIASKINIRSPIYVPFIALNNKGLLECIKADQIFIDNKEIKDLLIGLSDNNFAMDNIDCILNNQIREML